jgi:hypothetical protein
LCLKREATVVKNDKNELIPQRTITGWWMCIDYRKLNKATKKDYFPLPFIDEMLEHLANHSSVFLMGILDITRFRSILMIRAKPLLHVLMKLMFIVECLLDYVTHQLLFKDA